MIKSRILLSLLMLLIPAVFLILFSPIRAQHRTESISKPVCTIEETQESLIIKIKTSQRNEKCKVVLLFENENHSLAKQFTLHNSEESFILDKLSFPDTSYSFRLAMDMDSFYELSDTYLFQLNKKKPNLSLVGQKNSEGKRLVHQTKNTIRITSDQFLRKLNIHLNNKILPMQHYKSFWEYEGFLPLLPGQNQLEFIGENLHGAVGTLSLKLDFQTLQPARKIHSVLYHDIAYTDSNMSITPELFEKHIKYLADQGYYFVSSKQLEQYLGSTLSLPEKSVFVSFDDGCRGVLDYALPILKKYQAHASLFVTNSFIGKEGFINWQELKDLSDSGYFSIGSHSNQLHHQYWIPEINTLYFPIHQNKAESYEEYQQRLLHDFEYSKAEIEEHIQQEITSFAFPFGVHNSTARRILKKAGYRMALASNNRYRTSIVPSDEPFSLMRYTILSHVEPQAIILEEK
jgi:peptidoglycan/xylan/chitin deacetylase (PgdA/CDA1 family)